MGTLGRPNTFLAIQTELLEQIRRTGVHLELADLSISGNAKVVTMAGGKAAEIKEHELSLPGQVNSLHIAADPETS